CRCCAPALPSPVISGRDSRAVERRMTELGVSWVRQGVGDKLASLRELLDILGLGPQAVACIGDDTPDLPLLEHARLGVAVADAHATVREAAHYVTRLPERPGRRAGSLRPAAHRARSRAVVSGLSWKWVWMTGLIAAAIAS
ncbi:MAG: HAD hydrolase family protein, partial [Nocardioides sp.]